MEKPEHQYLGQFRIQNRWLPGQVSVNGRESRLEVYADKYITISSAGMRTIRGVARTGEKITICDAIGAELSGTQTYYDIKRYFISLLPHFVAVGPRHLDMDRKIISEIIFTTTGATGLFYDLGAFGHGHVKNIRRLMPTWAKKDRRGINFSEVFYYVDRGPIFSVKGKDIKFEAFNGVKIKSPSPRGISLANEVHIRLIFRRSVKLREAFKAVWEFRGFCEIVSQTKHCIQNISVQHKSAKEREAPLRIYPSHEETDPGDGTDFRDNLVSAGLNKREFETVLGRWMQQHEVRADARLRIVQGIRDGRSYTIDRLVGAANAFDLLPDTTFRKPKLPAKLLTTLASLAREAKRLQPPYRDQVLSNLHRVKGLTLRNKIESRFRSLPAGLRKRLPDMEMLIDHCVRSRNYFVHGSKPKLSVASTGEFLILFIETLEFIFVTSELAACGWDANRWIKQHGQGKIREYLSSYQMALAEVKKAASAKSAAKA